MIDVFKKISELSEARTPFVEILVVDGRGSIPTEIGARALVTSSGIFAGTIGGGKVEARAIDLAKSLLVKGETHFVTWNLQKDIGMTCGGEMKLFFKVHQAEVWSIAVFGAGHVAQALIPLLCTLDCRVYCIDSRSEWLDKIPEHQKLTKVISQNPASLVPDLPPDTFFVCMTQGHAFDFPILQKIFSAREAPYVGAIGSLSKSKVLKNDLLKSGLSAETVSKLICPIGLDLGDNSPAEIAVSVAAQLILYRTSRVSRPVVGNFHGVVEQPTDQKS
jgi:xanthine dehydrogenase accessory factor